PGVTVSVLGHSEVGSTLSRQNGEFDLVVNGGGSLVLVYAAEGYLESQRTFHPRWQEYVVLDTVTLITRDTVVNTVDLSSGAPMQAIQASVVSDGSGTRRATLLVPSGTKANLLLPDGTEQPLGSMRVRMTEYTVGASGPSAMPASLPPSSGYTYALEYTVEEALGANVGGVVFEAPVYGYVENFVGIPVGYAVPAAYYDKAKGVWVPQDDGRVIKIAAIQGGMADLVVDTSGLTASETHLDSLGITDSERMRLAELYAVNQTLWRVPIRHFSSADYNHPVMLPNDAMVPEAKAPRTDKDPAMTHCKVGSIIDCNRQSLGETITFPGLPSLNYRGNRVPSPRWRRITIDVTGPTISSGIVEVKLEVTLAGRKFKYSYYPNPGITQVIDWDGLDVYGREVRGKQFYTYSISHAYEVVYSPPPQLPRIGSSGNLDFGPRTFGTPSGLTYPSPVEARTTYDLSNTYTGYLGSADLDDVGPGWTLENHHVYDPTEGVLHMGDGTDVGVKAGLGGAYILTGKGNLIPGPDPIPAKDARTGTVNGLTVGPDGAVYFADRSEILKLDRSGLIRTLTNSFDPSELDVAADGSVYYTELDGNVIRRWSPDGTDIRIAGTGVAGYSGDGGPATQAQLNGPNNAVLGPDGSLYIADRGNSRLRRVTPDGIIQTVAGTGLPTYNGDDLPALKCNISFNHID
ncbi:MAG TPA: hypothetical protein VK465_02500, partial [Fibrobacteria bacterium]|nr:hypothetical protein [Fibrobacteria bacterium]